MSFLDYDFNSEQLTHKVLKKNNEYFNLPVWQIYNNSSNKLSQYKLTPINSYASTIHSNGGWLDFKLEKINGIVYKNFVFNFQLTENNTSANEIINGNMIVSKVELLEQGQNIYSYDNYWEYIFNCVDQDTNSFEKELLTQNAVLNTDYTKGISITQNTTSTIYIDLDTILSNIYLYRPVLSSDIVISVHIIAGISITADATLAFSNAFLYVNALQINPNIELSLLKQPTLDYNKIIPMHRTYNLANGITDGTEFEQLLTSYNHNCCAMIVFIQKNGDTLTNTLKTYAIEKIKVTDSNNQNVMNAMYHDVSFLKNLYAKYLFRGSDFWLKTNNNMYLISFCSDPRSMIIEGKFSGSEKFNSYKLFVTPDSTEASPCSLHVIFLTPSLLRLNEGHIQLYHS